MQTETRQTSQDHLKLYAANQILEHVLRDPKSLSTRCIPWIKTQLSFPTPPSPTSGAGSDNVPARWCNRISMLMKSHEHLCIMLIRRLVDEWDPSTWSRDAKTREAFTNMVQEIPLDTSSGRMAFCEAVSRLSYPHARLLVNEFMEYMLNQPLSQKSDILCLKLLIEAFPGKWKSTSDLIALSVCRTIEVEPEIAWYVLLRLQTWSSGGQFDPQSWSASIDTLLKDVDCTVSGLFLEVNEDYRKELGAKRIQYEVAMTKQCFSRLHYEHRGATGDQAVLELRARLQWLLEGVNQHVSLLRTVNDGETRGQTVTFPLVKYFSIVRHGLQSGGFAIQQSCRDHPHLFPVVNVAPEVMVELLTSVVKFLSITTIAAHCHLPGILGVVIDLFRLVTRQSESVAFIVDTNGCLLSTILKFLQTIVQGYPTSIPAGELFSALFENLASIFCQEFVCMPKREETWRTLKILQLLVLHSGRTISGDSRMRVDYTAVQEALHIVSSRTYGTSVPEKLRLGYLRYLCHTVIHSPEIQDDGRVRREFDLLETVLPIITRAKVTDPSADVREYCSEAVAILGMYTRLEHPRLPAQVIARSGPVIPVGDGNVSLEETSLTMENQLEDEPVTMPCEQDRSDQVWNAQQDKLVSSSPEVEHIGPIPENGGVPGREAPRDPIQNTNTVSNGDMGEALAVPEGKGIPVTLEESPAHTPQLCPGPLPHWNNQVVESASLVLIDDEAGDAPGCQLNALESNVTLSTAQEFSTSHDHGKGTVPQFPGPELATDGISRDPPQPPPPSEDPATLHPKGPHADADGSQPSPMDEEDSFPAIVTDSSSDDGPCNDRYDGLDQPPVTILGTKDEG